MLNLSKHRDSCKRVLSMQGQPLSAPLRIIPGFSRRIAAILAIIYGGALALLLTLDFPFTLSAALVLLLLSDAWRNVQRYVYYRHPWLSHELVLIHDYFLLADNREATLAPNCLVHPWLIVLNLKLDDGRRASRVLFPDALDPVTFRRLRVRLRHPLQDEAAAPGPVTWYARLGGAFTVFKKMLDKI